MASNSDPEAERSLQMKTTTDNLVRETEISRIKNELDGMSAEEINAFFDEKVEIFIEEVCQKADELKNTTQMPRLEPKSSDYPSNEAYQRACDDYQMMTTEAELNLQMKTTTDNLVRETETEISRTKSELKGMRASEINAFLDGKVESVKGKICRKANELKNTVKSYMPRLEPKRSDYPSNEAYQRALDDYQRKLDNFRRLVGKVISFLSSFSPLVDIIMNMLGNFFKQLWEWICKAAKFVVTKVCGFVSSVRNKVSSWWSSIFGKKDQETFTPVYIGKRTF